MAEQAIFAGGVVRSGARAAVAAVRRQLWVAVLVTALVAAVAIVRYASAAASRQQYTATQALVVQVLPAGGGAYTGAYAQQSADRLSRALASGAPLAAPAFDRAVAAQVDKDRDQVAARFGAAAAIALADLDPRAVRGALTATQASDQVVVTARWQTPAGAWALATAAGAVLTADPALPLGSLPADADGASLRVVSQGAVTAPALDPAPESAARSRLLETILLGLVGGLALAYAADRWPVWRRTLAERRLPL